MSLRIVSGRRFLGALKKAQDIELAASMLARGKNGVVPALEAAAERGAHVRVRLEADPYDPNGFGGRARANAAVAAELRADGVEATLDASAPGTPLHIKAVIADGRLFLDDRNWTADGRDVILETGNADDAAAVSAAVQGGCGASAHVAVRKSEALAMEADTILRSGGAGVVAESESFGSGAVANALGERAEAGEKVRLLVSSRDMRGKAERAVLERLSEAGVQVRLESGGRSGKLCVAGDGAWIGSANATAGFPDTIDWGARITSPPAIDMLRAKFERNWRVARPFQKTPSPSRSSSSLFPPA